MATMSSFGNKQGLRKGFPENKLTNRKAINSFYIWSLKLLQLCNCVKSVMGALLSIRIFNSDPVGPRFKPRSSNFGSILGQDVNPQLALQFEVILAVLWQRLVISKKRRDFLRTIKKSRNATNSFCFFNQKVFSFYKRIFVACFPLTFLLQKFFCTPWTPCATNEQINTGG